MHQKAISLLLTALCLLPLAALASEDAITFADPAIEAAIRDHLEKPDAPITAKDMLSIGVIRLHEGSLALQWSVETGGDPADYEFTPVRDLSDLVHCKNLYMLSLPGHEITDLSPLRGLKKLESVNISLCRGVTDVSLLLDLPQLSQLELVSIGTTDIDAVMALPTLRMLYIGDLDSDEPLDISALGGHDGLQEVRIAQPVADYTPLTGHTGLTFISDLRGIDAQTLAGLLPHWPALEGIIIDHGDLTGDDLAMLADKPLTFLRVEHTPLGSTDFINGLPALNSLILLDCGITDLSPIAGLTKLRYLNVSGNPLLDISTLSSASLGYFVYTPSEAISDADIEALLPDVQIMHEY